MNHADNYWVKKANRRGLLKGGAALGTGLGTLALVGCGDDDDNGGNGGPTSTATQVAGGSTPAGDEPHRRHHVFEEGTPTRGGTLTLSTNEPDSFDVYAGAGGYAKGIAQMIYNHMWRAHLPAGSGYEPFYEPDLIESYEQADDTTYILKVRQGVNWQDKDPVNGRELVADDIVQNLNRMRQNEPGYTLASRLAMIESVSETDEATVEVKLNRPNGYFVYNLADQDGVIIPPELHDGGAQATAVGTGPFVLEDWQRGSALILQANPNYWDTGLPYIDEVRYVIQTDFATNISNFIAGQIDTFNLLTPESEEQIRNQNPDAVLAYITAYPFTGALNTTSETQPALQDRRVRQAIKYATDYDAEINLGFGGHGFRGQPLSRIHGSNGLPESELPTRDVQRARSLLDEAGYGDGLQIVNSISNLVVPDQGHTQWVDALRDVGIEMELEVTPFNQWITRAFIQGQMEACSSGLFSYIPPDVQMSVKWQSDGGYNNSHYNNPDFDSLLDTARQELDLEAAQEHYQRLSRMVLDDSPDIFLLENEQLVGKQGRVKNWTFSEGWWSGSSMWWDVAWLDG